MQLGILLPFFSERSVAANALGLGPRDRRCNSCRSDQFFRCVAQLAGAPVCEAGEMGANPIHLTTLLVEMKESNQPSVEGKSVGASPITSAS